MKMFQKILVSGAAGAACLALFALPAAADREGDWEYRTSDGQAAITAYLGKDPAVSVPDVLGEFRVTEIGENAFSGNIALESVEIPETVVTIGEEAFSDCSSLTSVVLPESLTGIGSSAFRSSRLKSLVIPDSVTYIGEYAFENCTGLRTVTLGSGITDWGTDWGTNGAFHNCTLLTGLEISDGVAKIGPYAFQGCTLLTEVQIPASVTEVGDGAFLDCELLETVSVNGSVRNRSFENCTSLKTVTLENVDILGDQAFLGDTSLKEIVLPEFLKSVGERAFDGCTKLREMIIPDSVEYVGPYAFRHCTQLEKAVLGSGIAGWGLDWGVNEAFGGCTKLTDVTVREGCASIPPYCFQGCTALERIEIPGSCESIGEAAFRFCTALKEAVLNEGILYIYPEAFNEASALQKAELPSTLLTVDNYAFHNTRLLSVRIPDRVMTIGYYAFSDNPALRTVAIGESVETWKTDWGTNGAFKNDVRLECLEISEGCMLIGSYAFEGCIDLQSVDVPITVTSVGEGAFLNCSGLTHVSIQRGEIGIKAFKGCSALYDLSVQRITAIRDEAFSGCAALPEIILPETVTHIGARAFDTCNSLSEIVIPESVTFLGAYAFANCEGLLSAYISNNITEWGTEWGDSAVFASDTALRNVYVDEGANSLGSLLFYRCSALAGVYLPESVVSYPTNLFAECPESATVYGKGPKVQALAAENERPYSGEAFELPVPETVTLTFLAGPGGRIAPEGMIEKPVGSVQAFSILPNPGYTADILTSDGSRPDEMILRDIKAASRIEAAFAEIPDYEEEYPIPEEEPEQEQTSLAAEEDGNVCANCGYEFPEESSFLFCPQCGTPRE